MIRLILYLVGVALLAAGLSWLADRPGSLVLTWQGYEAETSIFRAVVLLAFLIGLTIVAWSIFRQIWTSPAVVGRFLNRRRQERGLDALSSGMIAVGAGDRALATRYALQARRALPNEPLTHLLRAQAAQLSGDRTTARRIFEAMLSTPDTEQLGLRGLFLEAERTGEPVAARQFAERALKLNPKLGWPVDALFELQCIASDWAGALETLAIGRRHGHVDHSTATRRRAVLLTAQAQEAEDSGSDKVLGLALEAHNLAPDLVPAAAIAGRMLASRGSTPKAARVLEKTWKRSPHPDLAVAYAYARPGDSPRDRLDRVKRLAKSTPHSIEGPIAIANSAIEARDWDAARKALEPLLETRLTQRICTLMARIEGEQRNDAGRVREWLARAVNAPRDPAWTADGVVSDRWAPISPVTGALDAFQWRVPVESADAQDQSLLNAKLEELVELGARREAVIEAKPVAAQAVAVEADSAAPSSDAEAAGPADAGGEATAVPAEKKPEAPPASPASARQETAKAEPDAEPKTARPAAVEAAKPAKAGGKAGRPPPAASKAGDREAVARPEAGTASGPEAKPTATARSKSAEPRIFVPSRAPDDPGPEDAPEGLAISYRTRGADR
ncbi:MAG: heme biosynthesis HemY N-terminal domain-containing protein [Bacteroidota bacterium]